MLNNKSYYILILSFLVLSCESADLSLVEGKLNSISDNQGKILDKLEIVQKDVEKVIKSQKVVQEGIADLKKREKAPVGKDKDNKKQQPPKADPNKVYDVAIGNSIVFGKKDASVTIVEWTDFQ